jgi:rhodanese-related sulfurtransferase
MPETSVAEAAILLEEGALLLDVREPEEWEAGHVPGALLIPMGMLGTRLGELPSDQAVVVICRSGHRSGIVTAALTRAGLEAVNLAGGMLAWAAEGRAVVSGDGAPGIVI